MELLSRGVDLFQSALAGLHDLLEPVFQQHAWGWAIIALTLVIRLLLLPLAIKQIRSMRAMQAIQPQMKELQKKYKVDRDLMKKDPEQYKAKKQKLNEEMMALYQEEGVNPMASCLPLLAQAPVFLALFRVLQGERAEALTNAPFYFITSQSDQGLTSLVSASGWPGWLLIVLMAATMFISQKQMMARQATSGADNPMAQQQKIMLYAMPVVLGAISFNLPLGVLLYWVTTNLWQAVQQWFMLREVQHEVEEGTLAEHRGGEAAARFKLGKGKANGNGKGKAAPGASPKGRGGATSGKGGASSGKGGASSGKGGATSGKGGATSGKGGATSGKGGASSGKQAPRDEAPDADGGKASGEGPSSKGKGGTPAGGSRGKSGGPAATSGPGQNGTPRSSGRSKSDHIPRRGERR